MDREANYDAGGNREIKNLVELLGITELQARRNIAARAEIRRSDLARRRGLK